MHTYIHTANPNMGAETVGDSALPGKSEKRHGVMSGLKLAAYLVEMALTTTDAGSERRGVFSQEAVTLRLRLPTGSMGTRFAYHHNHTMLGWCKQDRRHRRAWNGELSRSGYRYCAVVQSDRAFRPRIHLHDARS